MNREITCWLDLPGLYHGMADCEYRERQWHVMDVRGSQACRDAVLAILREDHEYGETIFRQCERAEAEQSERAYWENREAAVKGWRDYVGRIA